jgi:hypothetical protein
VQQSLVRCDRAETGESPKGLLSQLESLYAGLGPGSSAPARQEELAAGLEVSRRWFDGDLDKRRHFLHTGYHEVEKMTNSLIIKW